MKKYLKTAFLLLLLSTSLSAGSFNLDGAKSLISSGGLDGIIKSNGIKDLINSGKQGATNTFIGMLNSNLDGAGNLMDVCYVYKPKPIKNFDFSFNICNSLPNINNFCDLAPSLSKYGYEKKSSSNTDALDIKSYCNDIFGTGIEKSISITEMIKNVDYSKEIYSDLKEETIKKPSEISDKIFSENSPLNYKNAWEQKDKNKETAGIYNAIIKNDYESIRAYKMVLKRADKDTITKDSNFKNINVPYNTVADYDKSVTKLRDNRKKLLESLSIVELSKKAETAFNTINAGTEDRQERATQKEAQLVKFYDEYVEMLEKWANMETNIQLMTNYKEEIVYPTKELVNRYKQRDRAKVVYRIEEQKTKKVQVLNNIDRGVQELKDKVHISLQNEMLRSMEFDRQTALQEIEALLGS